MDIRKISVGTGYPDNSIYYQVGKKINLVGVPYEITSILVDEELKEFGVISYDVYLSNDLETILWKSISGVPVVIEYNVMFQ